MDDDRNHYENVSCNMVAALVELGGDVGCAGDVKLISAK